jgi:hypothetical protein
MASFSGILPNDIGRPNHQQSETSLIILISLVFQSIPISGQPSATTRIVNHSDYL